MLRSTVAVLVLAVSPVTMAKTKPWKPHPIKVIPGVPLKAEDIKPYVPPHLPPEPSPEPSTVKTIQVLTQDAVVDIRPWSSPLVGTITAGTRVAVKGIIKGHGCHVWYALEPFGYICSHDVRPTDEPPTTEPTLKVREGSRLPFQYVMLLVKEGDKVPMWASLDDMKKQAEPERQLERGDTVAIEKPYVWDGVKYWLTVDGKVIPQKSFIMMGGGAEWHGIDLTDKTPLPFGWITPPKANVYDAPPPKPSSKATPVQLERRTRVNIVGEQMVGRRKWLQVTVADPPPPPTHGDIFIDRDTKKKDEPEATAVAPMPSPMPQMWVSADAINEVRLLEKPKTVPDNVDKWIDVDLGEQVLVLYEGGKPVFATLVSSGRAIPTPMGTYPVWAKAASITMKNQGYEDKEYFVNRVPWSTFFQWHNAIHGAYWHDRFGVVKSHGCVNVSPLDARHVFEWVTPPLPPGWSGLRPLDLLTSPYVVVRNSHMKRQFRQDRPIGAPDRELESERLEEAEQRRAAEAAQPSPAPQTTPPPPVQPVSTPAH